MPQEIRYGVIPKQANGWSFQGYTAEELRELCTASAEQESGMCDLLPDAAILPRVIEDLLGAAEGYSNFPEALA